MRNRQLQKNLDLLDLEDEEHLDQGQHPRQERDQRLEMRGQKHRVPAGNGGIVSPE